MTDEAGYTVVEVVVALALLTIALLPTTQFAAKLILNSQSRDLITASQLARAELERAIADLEIGLDEALVQVGYKTWRVERRVTARGVLLTLIIKVFKADTRQPIVELMTLRLAND